MNRQNNALILVVSILVLNLEKGSPLRNLDGVPLALLSLLQRFHRSVQSMSVVSSELGICALEGRISVGLWLLDTIVRNSS